MFALTNLIVSFRLFVLLLTHFRFRSSNPAATRRLDPPLRPSVAPSRAGILRNRPAEGSEASAGLRGSSGQGERYRGQSLQSSKVRQEPPFDRKTEAKYAHAERRSGLCGDARHDRAPASFPRLRPGILHVSRSVPPPRSRRRARLRGGMKRELA